MRITLGWARCADNVADILRRGAWYPIVEESPDGHVVVEVRQQRVRVARVDVTIRAEPPDTCSLVARTGVSRPTLGAGGLGTAMAAMDTFCLFRHSRQGFATRPANPQCVWRGAT